MSSFSVDKMLPLLLVLIIETPNISALSLGTGLCKKQNNNNIWYTECCQGYKFNQINQTCDECPEGKRGYNCQDDCDENFFGLRCKGRCSCKQNETCNKVHGCIIIENNIEALIHLIAAEDSPSISKDGLTEPTESNTTLKDVLTVPTEDMTTILKANDDGNPLNSIIIAVLLAGSVIIVLVIIWKEREKICRQITNTQVSSVHERNKTRHANVDDESAYSEIRESKMVRPMTTYGRKLSQCELDNQYNHVSFKDTNGISRINNYIYNMPTKYSEPTNRIENDCENTEHADRPNGISRINNYIYDMPTKYSEPIDRIVNNCEKTFENTDQV